MREESDTANPINYQLIQLIIHFVSQYYIYLWYFFYYPQLVLTLLAIDNGLAG